MVTPSKFPVDPNGGKPVIVAHPNGMDVLGAIEWALIRWKSLFPQTTHTEMAKRFGISNNRLKTIIHSPMWIEAQADYAAELALLNDIALQRAGAILMEAAPVAAQGLVDMMKNPKMGADCKRKTMVDILNHPATFGKPTGGGPVIRVEGDNAHVQVLSVEDQKTLREVAQRAVLQKGKRDDSSE